MTIDQIDRLVRDANPVPDLGVLEPDVTSDLHAIDERSAQMQTKEQEVATTDERPSSRAVLAGAAAAALILIGGIVVLSNTDVTAPAADQPSLEIADSFLREFGNFNIKKAYEYLAYDADLSHFTPTGNRDDLGWYAAWLQATGYTQTRSRCTEVSVTAARTTVRCPFQYRALRSDELGFGPYGDSYFDLTVVDGKITSAWMTFGLERFSEQVWEPFANWVSATYPEDAAVMFTNSSLSKQRITEESNQLWEEHTQEFVLVAPAFDAASNFVTAYADFDRDNLTKYMTTVVDVSGLDGGADWEMANRVFEAQALKLFLRTCMTGPAGTTVVVSCPFDFHDLRSDEMGLGPFSGSPGFEFAITGGEIVRVGLTFETAEFSPQVWEPFAAWVAANHPNDLLSMYTDDTVSAFALSEESIGLWDKYTREYAAEQSS